jgi:hypothetical protein
MEPFPSLARKRVGTATFARFYDNANRKKPLRSHPLHRQRKRVGTPYITGMLWPLDFRQQEPLSNQWATTGLPH